MKECEIIVVLVGYVLESDDFSDNIRVDDENGIVSVNDDNNSVFDDL